MASSPRFQKTSGTTKEGYDWSLEVAPHQDIDIPGVGEMCGTSLRGCLGAATPEQFEAIMGWFDPEIYEMLQSRLSEISAMSAGNVQGGMIGTGSKKGPWHNFDAEAFNKRQKKDAQLRGAKEFIGEEEELVNEVMHYLLGITVG